MKQQFFAFSLTACAVSAIVPTQAFAVTLYGAGSLQNSLTEVAQAFTKEYGINIDTYFGPSGLTEQKIEQEISTKGQSTDVFASADLGNPQKLFVKGLSEPVKNFTSNRMTAIVRPGLTGVTSDNLLDFLLNTNIKVGTSTPGSDPSGDYAWQIFDKADAVKSGNSQILKNKALQLVGGNPSAPSVPTGQNNLIYFLKTNPTVDIFLAYYTSGKSAQKLEQGNDLQIVELPDYLATKADYGLTVLKNADPDGEKLAAYILSSQGQAILSKYGFSSPTVTQSVPEHQGIGGYVLALSIALAMHKKLNLAQKTERKIRS
ncbi:molybdate ABC transporter substrate-binding protein [Nostocaceae cyanobacterium CENA369]|uniref:Molybdate ABC transporter substrate-binding protein n=1 Tax=Dendronalium phyllosphericum CENA369 TaxID=1725256 RepID=A0A8J7I095_9NOST|nr:molybdate ABC transporter substrate-binding protein [Dendronalium phyllosphericum]MBH8573584.1 molybdate ABC transporter substrate-binding protein [Dendronalium phyllosphericum CENA369]